jgi:hypothetical protein
LADRLSRVAPSPWVADALEIIRPLALLGSQAIWLGQPLLSLVVPGRVLTQAARVLEAPDGVEALIACLRAPIAPEPGG